MGVTKEDATLALEFDKRRAAAKAAKVKLNELKVGEKARRAAFDVQVRESQKEINALNVSMQEAGSARDRLIAEVPREIRLAVESAESALKALEDRHKEAVNRRSDRRFALDTAKKNGADKVQVDDLSRKAIEAEALVDEIEVEIEDAGKKLEAAAKAARSEFEKVLKAATAPTPVAPKASASA